MDQAHSRSAAGEGCPMFGARAKQRDGDEASHGDRGHVGSFAWRRGD